MSCQDSSSNINQTFIIEPLSITGGSPTISACTALYTNTIISCSGDTEISLGNGYVTFNNNLLVNNSISGDSFYGNNFYSGGTNLLDIFITSDKYITGGTFNHSGETLTLTRNDDVNLTITGFTDFYTTGGTIIGSVLFFDRTDSLSAYTIDLSSIVLTDTYVTGGTFNQITRILTLTKNDNISIDISGFTDVFTTGATYSNGYAYFDRNDSLSAYTLDLTPLTGDANTFVTGGTLSGNTLILERNDDYQIGIDLTDIRFSGGSGYCISNFYVTNIHGCSPVTIHDKLILLSGLTINIPPQDNSQSQIIVRDSGTGDIKYRDVQSIISAATSQDIYVTGLTFNNNLLTISRNDNVSISSLINNFSGLTVNGSLIVSALTATTISATTYFGLPVNSDIFVTGGTYSNSTGSAIFTNNTGTTFNVSGFFKPSDDIFTTGLTFNPANYNLTITKNDNTSYTTNLGILASDVTITGGTYNSNTGVVTFINNTGGTFSVSGFITGFTDTRISAFTYSNNIFTITDSTGGTFNTLFNTVTGLTVNGNLTITGNTNFNIISASTISASSISSPTISATTYLGLPIDVRVTGGTYNNGTAIFTNNTGGTFNVNGFFTGTSIYLTGGTFNTNTDTLTLINNTGGTFSITGITDFYTTGATLINSILYFNRNDGLSAYTADLSQLSLWVPGSAGIYSLKANNNSGLDATNEYALAEGYATTASGKYSHAEGYITTAMGMASHAEGDNTTAIGQASHAEGDENVSIGKFSHAEGVLTTSVGQSTHTEGQNTFAYGNASHAEGYVSVANGNFSHAEGWLTFANGIASHAEGYSTSSFGDYSHTGGGNDVLSTGTIKAIGIASFNHSFSNINEPIYGAVGDYSAIIGGLNQNILSGSTSSGIFAGSGNKINTNIINSVIIGGYGITAFVSNTVYVPKLNIVSGLTNDNTLSQVLVRAIDGEIKYRTVQSIIDTASGATTGSTITAFTYNNANTLILTRIDGVSLSANFSTITGITTTGDIIPSTNNSVNLGSPIVRFRQINTVSGVSSVWTSTTSVTTASLELGLDSNGNTRTINANNSIIQNDCLNSGQY